MNFIKYGLLITAFLLPSFNASAQAYNALSQCVIDSTSKVDRLKIAKLYVLGVSLHPETKDLFSVTATQRNKMKKQSLDVFNRLIFEDCKAEADKTLAIEGQKGIEQGFEVLGKVAMTEIYTHPSVLALFEEIGESGVKLYEGENSTGNSYKEKKEALEKKILASRRFPARPVWWHDDTVLAVGIVLETKTNLEAVASEACGLLQQSGFPNMTVEVFDVVKIQKLDEWELLIKRRCDHGDLRKRIEQW